MEDVNAKKPDDVVDVENSFRAKLGAQLVVDEEKQDIKHLKDGPPKHGCMGHLGIAQWAIISTVICPISYTTLYHPNTNTRHKNTRHTL